MTLFDDVAVEVAPRRSRPASRDTFEPAGALLYEPRWYQTETIQQTREWWEDAQAAGEPFARGLYPHATGTGKGHLALLVIKAFPELARHGVLFLVEYDAVVWQQVEAFREAFPSARVEVEKA